MKAATKQLSPDDWYALVFETADRLRKGLEMTRYESMHYAAEWLRGTRIGNG